MVDLGDQRAGVRQRVRDVVDTDAQRDLAVAVRRRHLHQADIGRQQAAGEHAWNGRVVARHDVEQPVPAQQAQVPEPAVREHREAVRERHGQVTREAVVPGQTAEGRQRSGPMVSTCSSSTLTNGSGSAPA